MPDLTPFIAQWGYAAIFVVCVLTFRRGLVGELARLLKKPL